MSKENWQKYLTEKMAANACEPGSEWVKGTSGLVEAWDTCQDGYWMLWLAFLIAGDDAAKKKDMLKEILPLFTVESSRVPAGAARNLYTSLLSAMSNWCEKDAQEELVKTVNEAKSSWYSLGLPATEAGFSLVSGATQLGLAITSVPVQAAKTAPAAMSGLIRCYALTGRFTPTVAVPGANKLAEVLRASMPKYRASLVDMATALGI